jgi:hypothetical protein
MIQKDNPQLWFLMVQDGADFFEYRPQTKTLRIYPVGPGDGLFSGQGGELIPRFIDKRIPLFPPFSNLLDVDPDDVLRRYEIKLTKKDENYTYLEIYPRGEEAWLTFNRAQLVVFTRTYLPSRLWLEWSNGDELTWEFVDWNTMVKLKPSHFIAPKTPQGWTTERIPLPDRKNLPEQKAPDLKDMLPPAKQ